MASVPDGVPSYGLYGKAERWHPPGRGNGYVVTVDGLRLYVAGSTEAVPEMLALADIDLAFLPLYPPYALAPVEAMRVVLSIRPIFAYIYQYRSKSIRDDFLRMGDHELIETTIIAPDIDA